MKKKIPILIACVCLLLAACAPVVQQQSAMAKAVVSFPSNSSTGYRWVYKCDKSIKITDEYVSSDAEEKGAVGAGGTQTFTIVPGRDGNYRIVFKYTSVADGQSDEIARYDIAVRKGDITVTSSSRKVHNYDGWESADVIPLKVVK